MPQVIGYGSGTMGGGAPGAILRQSGVFATCAREAAGVYLVTMAAGHNIQPNDTFVTQRTFPVGGVPNTSHASAVERVSQTQFRIRISAAGGAGLDAEVDVEIARTLVG